MAVEQAMVVMAEKLKDVVPDAFEGDGVAYMQSVYRDPSFPVDLRLDAASKAARYERPALVAAAVKDVTPDRDPASRTARITELLRKGLAGGAVAIISD